MKKVILIDYENVQKHDLRPLLSHDVLIKVFHNPNQKFTANFTTLALDFGKEKIELIEIKGQGKNAADFHIAYFIGKLSKEIPGAEFHIISKDTGFKVLADFLNQRQGIACRVEASINEIGLSKQTPSVVRPVLLAAKKALPIAKPAAQSLKPVMATPKPVAGATRPAAERTIQDWCSLVVRKLINSKVQKPKKKKTLRNQIISICERKLSGNDADAIIQKLIDNKFIVCNNEAVIYGRDAGM
jgi:hypothetical protein